MRKEEREIKSFDEVEAVVRAARIVRLGLAVDDVPYVVPVNFGYEPGRLYFHCALEGRKLDMMRKNPRVAFEVEMDVEMVSAARACGWTVKFRSVIGSGLARIVKSEEEKVHGLDVLMRHHGGPVEEYSAKALEKTCVVAVEIEEMTGKKLHYD